MARRKVVFRVAGACLLASACMVPLVGCSSQTEETATQEETQEVEESYLAIGSASDDALTMIFENATDKTISSVAVKDVSSEDDTYTELKIDGDAWESGVKAQVYCEAYESSATTSSGNEVVLNAAYDIQLTYEDGTTNVLNDVTFEEAESVTVLIDEESGLAYLSYEVDSSEATTLEAEKAVKQQEDEEAAAAQAAAEAEAAAAAEAEAAAAAEAEAAAQESSSNSYSYDYSSSGSSGSSAGQSEDSCIDSGDLVLR